MCFRCKLSNAATVSCIIRCDRPEELYENFLSALDDYRTPHQQTDTARITFYLYPRLKEHLRGRKFEDYSEVMAAVEAFWESQNEVWIQDQ